MDAFTLVLEMAREMARERTLVILKPDATRRQLSGEILARLERAGLKIVGLKMLMATRERLAKHFPSSEEWMRGMAQKSLDEYAKFGIDPADHFGTRDSLEIGKKILESCYGFYLSGPLIAAVLEGVGAVAVVRKMIGNTLPAQAAPGTIRGDFACDDAMLSNAVGSPTKNIIHASGNREEAEVEIACWFEAGELVDYHTAAERYAHFAGERFGWDIA